MCPTTADISQIDVKALAKRSFPIKPNYRITISRKAHEAIHAHAKEDSEHELGGALVGQIYQDETGPFLEISAAIRGQHTSGQSTQLEFTPETWADINQVRETQFAELRIVGWYHTHPRWGIFLSPQDTFIHENFFNLPWQVAYVVDPVSDTEGFFIWVNGKAEQSERFFIEGTEKATPQRETDEKGRDAADSESEAVLHTLKGIRKGVGRLPALLGWLVIVVFLLAVLANTNRNFQQIHANQNMQAEILAGLIQARGAANLEAIKNALSQESGLADLDIRLKQEGAQVWCSGEVYTLQQKEQVARVIGRVPGVAGVDVQGLVATHQYLTQPNDNLSTIAGGIYGDPGRWQEIFEANREQLNNPDDLRPSMTLKIPEKGL